VKVVEPTLSGQRVSAMSAPHKDTFDVAISMVVLCENHAELDRYWGDAEGDAQRTVHTGKPSAG
jgi:predicted 3-demethylubiquinone-9 3-methyltransferase (glyoxalase superfamily)